MPIRIEIPPDVRFDCSMCADCCRTWNILLGKGERERIESLDWSGAAETPGEGLKTRPVEVPHLKGHHQLTRREDGTCKFLGARNQCLIHEQFGAEAKPLVCQLYPFAFYPMGDRVALDVSFSCNAVSRMEGRLLEDRVPEWTAFLRDVLRPKDRNKHFLTREQRISGELMWDVEHHLVRFLKASAIPFHDRIRCCFQYLKLGTTGDPSASTAGMFRDAIAEGIPSQLGKLPRPEPMDVSQRALFFQWVFLATNPLLTPLNEIPGREQEKERQRRMELGNRYQEGSNRPWVDGRDLPVTFDEVWKHPAGVLREQQQPLLERLFSAKVVGKRYLVARDREVPLVEGARQMLLEYALICWTAKALSAERGARPVDWDDLRRAVRLVTRTSGALALDDLPKKQAEAAAFLFYETDFVTQAAEEILTAG